jgi:hypothetical protein
LPASEKNHNPEDEMNTEQNTLIIEDQNNPKIMIAESDSMGDQTKRTLLDSKRMSTDSLDPKRK